MGLYLLKLLLWCPTALANPEQGSKPQLHSPQPLHTSAPLPCLNSSNECVTQLTEKAISPHNSSLPCLDSSSECVNQLTEKAIASSNKLKKLNEKIALINERLELMGDHEVPRYARSHCLQPEKNLD
jgi:hypothetical protein